MTRHSSIDWLLRTLLAALTCQDAGSAEQGSVKPRSRPRNRESDPGPEKVPGGPNEVELRIEEPNDDHRQFDSQHAAHPTCYRKKRCVYPKDLVAGNDEGNTYKQPPGNKDACTPNHPSTNGAGPANE
jgi:hypothetical protein